ncbi:MAG: glycosyltransferase family 2 protein [Desulfuromonadaceae bacterium]|nr:glycosyltransferase family 2 protein [Desulfuromonadaceae bacterium]
MVPLMRKLSVIIPTCRRPQSLQRALRSITTQTLSPEQFEIILVDNAPSAASEQVARDFQKVVSNLRYVVESAPGLHRARHRGVREAVSDILVFADDDIEACPTWLQAIEESFHNEKVVLVGGKCLPKFDAKPPDWFDLLWERNAFGRVNGWYSLTDFGNTPCVIPALLVYGCNFSIRRSVLMSCRGFHPDSMPWALRQFRGDGETHVSDWITANGLKACYNPHASVFHCIPAERITMRYLCRRAFLQGISYSYAVTRRTSSLKERCTVILQRVASVLLNQVVFGRGGVRRHWLFLVCGILWHQGMLALNPPLLVWIRKEDYFE